MRNADSTKCSQTALKKPHPPSLEVGLGQTEDSQFSSDKILVVLGSFTTPIFVHLSDEIYYSCHENRMKQHDWQLSPDRDQVVWAGSRCCSSATWLLQCRLTVTFVGHQHLHHASRWPPLDPKGIDLHHLLDSSSKWLTFIWVSSLCVCVCSYHRWWKSPAVVLWSGSPPPPPSPHHSRAPLPPASTGRKTERERDVMRDTEESRCHGNSENLLLLLYWEKRSKRRMSISRKGFSESTAAFRIEIRLIFSLLQSVRHFKFKWKQCLYIQTSFIK